MTNNQKKLIMLCLLLLGCGLTNFLTEIGKDEAVPPQLPASSFVSAAKDSKAPKTIKVHVSGAVLEPGLYDLPAGSRADSAIAAAGGFTEQADSGRVNLARKLKDGMQVYVPLGKQFRTKAARTAASQGGITGESMGSGAAYRGSSTVAASVNINTASAAELEALPGIGPAMANRIIAQRSVRPFAKVEDLLLVRGIGPAKLAKLRPLVRVR